MFGVQCYACVVVFMMFLPCLAPQSAGDNVCSAMFFIVLVLRVVVTGLLFDGKLFNFPWVFRFVAVCVFVAYMLPVSVFYGFQVFVCVLYLL